MLICGALAWYAETEATLERCARSLGGVCDILIALGGRWGSFPELPGDDPAGQAAALRRGCDAAGVICDIAYDGLWESQVSKRAELMAAARGSTDWIFVIDADEYVVDVDLDALTKTLSETRADVATIHGIRVPITGTSARRPWRRIYRASTGVTVEHAHNGYRASDGRWLYGDPAHVQLEPAVDATKCLLLAHDIAARTDERREARMRYKVSRRDQGLELWPVRVPA